MCERRAALEQGESFEKSMAAEIVEASSRPAERSASFFDAANHVKSIAFLGQFRYLKLSTNPLFFGFPKGC
jgi:hypothetical protein